MKATNQKGPRFIIDFGDELARQLASERITQIIENYITSEASVDSAGAARLLSYSLNEFRKAHSKKIPVAELGSGAKGNRYRIKDVIAYREKNTVHPKS